MYRTGALAEVSKEMEESKSDIIGICETRWTGRGHFTTQSGKLVIYSGGDEHHRGVGVILSREASKANISYKAVSDRIITVEVSARPSNITLIQVYAPTSAATELEKEAFYTELQTTIKQAPSQDIVMVCGDFNAKVGKQAFNTPNIGVFGLGDTNEEGERLVNFCIDNNLTITNTKFQHHPRRCYTWTSPDQRTRNQIDYILISQRWNRCVTNSRAYPGFDCGSDHNLVAADVRLRIRRSNVKVNKLTFNLNKLRQEAVENQYTIAIRNRFSTLKILEEERSTEDMWQLGKEAILGAAEAVLGQQERKIRKPWISEYSVQLMERRRTLKPLKHKSINDRDNYKEVSSTLQRQLRRDKEEWIQYQCKDAEEGLRRHDTRSAYRTVKQLTKDFTPRQRSITDKENKKEFNKMEDILKRWKEYGESLFQDHVVQDNELPGSDESPLSVLKSEVQAAIRKLPNGKAPGCDAIQAELIKKGGENVVEFFTKLCNKILEEKRWPKEWTQSLFIPLPKKVGTKKCEEHRTISLISHSSKILLRILLERIKNQTKTEINETQMGFRAGLGTRDQIFNLRIIAEKAREFNQDVYLAFIDFSKAFDSVKHRKLWSIMEKLNVDRPTIQIIRALYRNQEACIRIEQQLTEWFEVGKGVRQGCLLSPICFNLYTEHIMRHSADTQDTGISINGKRLNNLRYADDIVLMTKSEQELQNLLNVVNTISVEHGLKINISKTKVMVISKHHKDIHIECERKTLQQVQQFKYLGAIITENCDCSTEIRARLGQGRSIIQKLSRIWKSRSLSHQSKLRILRTLVWPVATYAAETWTLTKGDVKRIAAFEMYGYRRILRVSWTERRTNEYVLRQLNIRPELINSIKKRKLAYFGHITRAQNLMTEVSQGLVEGQRSRGRQKIRWNDNIAEWTDMKINDCTMKARSRREWRRAVKSATEIANPQT